MSSRFSSPKPPSQQSERTMSVRAVQLQPRQFRGKGIHMHMRNLQPCVEIWILSSYWLSHCDWKWISCLASHSQLYYLQIKLYAEILLSPNKSKHYYIIIFIWMLLTNLIYLYPESLYFVDILCTNKCDSLF